MSLQDKFIEKGYRRVELEAHIKENFPRAGFSKLEMERVPLGTRIVIYCDRPGLMIGRGGEKVQELTKVIEKKFDIENPQLDIKSVDETYLDPQIVSERIASSIERGMNYRRTVNITMKRIMSAGAIGCFIRVGGKLSGEMSRFEKFSSGYLKHAGEPARALVNRGKSEAQTKMGTVGVQVKIMPNTPEVLESLGYSRKALEQKSIEVEEDKEKKKKEAAENILEDKKEDSEEKEEVENILEDKKEDESEEDSETQEESKGEKPETEDSSEEETQEEENSEDEEEAERENILDE